MISPYRALAALLDGMPGLRQEVRARPSPSLSPAPALPLPRCVGLALALTWPHSPDPNPDPNPDPSPGPNPHPNPHPNTNANTYVEPAPHQVVDLLSAVEPWEAGDGDKLTPPADASA